MNYLGYIKNKAINNSKNTMKRTVLSFMALACLLSQSTASAAGAWTDDLEVATKQAAADKKDILILFTGSTWCGPCITLKNKVFTTAFETDAAKDFVLVKFDIPDPEGSVTPDANTESAMRSYGISSFPTVLLANDKGLPYAKAVTLVRGVDTKIYLSHLQLLKSDSAIPRKAFSEADAETDPEKKAQKLSEALPFFFDNEVSPVFYFDSIKAIAVGDKAGKHEYAGSKYRTHYLNITSRIVSGYAKAKKWALAHSTLDALLAEISYPDEEKQYVLFLKGQVYEVAKDLTNAIKTYEDAEKLAPSSDVGKALNKHIEELKSRDSDVLDPK